MKNVGILTLPFEPNYGFLLQAYALSETLRRLGINPIHLNRGWNRKRNPSLLYKFKRVIYYKYFCRDILGFYKRIPTTVLVRSGLELKKLCYEYNLSVVISGSDQVWSIPNTRGADLNYFFDFLDSDSGIKRFSYAASFGKAAISATDEEKMRIKSLLKCFHGISVREDSGLEILKNEFGVNASCVLDPTLLLTRTDYCSLFNNTHHKKKLLTTYILDNTDLKRQAIATFAKLHGLQVRNLYDRKYTPYYSVEFWLKSICDADYVIVDSFHGMVFSIIFQKEFFAIVNKKRGEARFVSLLSKLNLSNRLIYNLKDINEKTFKSIDYKEVNQLLKKERDNSLAVLKSYII